MEEDVYPLKEENFPIPGTSLKDAMKKNEEQDRIEEMEGTNEPERTADRALIEGTPYASDFKQGLFSCRINTIPSNPPLYLIIK